MMSDREVANGPRVIESSNYPRQRISKVYNFIIMDWCKLIFG